MRAIVRPAIVESAVAFPFRGWNEGFTTSAPLVYLALKGQNVLPVSPKLILDVVPVDHVVAAMLMVAAQAIVEQPKLVFQLSSGDLNPLHMDRVVTLTGLYKRQRFTDKETGNKFLNELAARMEFRPVTEESYDRLLDPGHPARREEGVGDARPHPAALGRGAVHRGHRSRQEGRSTRSIGSPPRRRRTSSCSAPSSSRTATSSGPTTSARCATACAPEDQQQLCLGAGERSTIYDYWMNIHFPGLARWVLPELDETYAPRPKQVYSYHDLLELFDTTTKLHATRTALRIERGKREEIYSYADLPSWRRAWACSSPSAGSRASERVMLFAKNAPEWSMAYFGILKAGATAVPVGHESSVAELVNVARASGAVGILIGDDLLRQARGGARGARSPRRGSRPSCGRSPRRSRCRSSRSSASAGAALAAPAEPRRARVAHLHLGDDRQAQGGDADPPQLHLHGVGAVEDVRVRRQRRDAVGAAAVAHLRVRDRPAGAARARRADHLPARADRRRDHSARSRRGTSPRSSACPRCGICCGGACSSASPTSRPCSRRS